MGKIVQKGAEPPKLRPKTRHAIHLIITEDITQREAARRAGMHEAALSTILQKPEVKAYVEDQKALFLGDIDKLRARGLIVAYKVAIELATSGSSETVRLKAVEFLAGGKAPGGVNVQINNAPGGYEYPGRKFKDVSPPSPADTQSGAEEGQEP